MSVIGLAPHQQRVVAERNELCERLGKLSAFLATETYMQLPEPERVRLVRQASIMGQYSDVLAERIEAF